MKKALFLDRDGVVNVEKDYVYRVEDFEFMDGIFDVCRHFQSKGYIIVIITNQSGIARGYYTEDDFRTLTDWMVGEFRKEGIVIAGVYHCPHHPDITGECECRKPKPGLILKAKADHDINLAGSVLVGDSERDIEAGEAAGVGRRVLFEISSIRHTGVNNYEIAGSLRDIG